MCLSTGRAVVDQFVASQHLVELLRSTLDAAKRRPAAPRGRRLLPVSYSRRADR
jgi:hypothetical protein